MNLNYKIKTEKNKKTIGLSHFLNKFTTLTISSSLSYN